MGSNPILSAILLRAARFAGQALQSRAKQDGGEDALRSLGEGGPVRVVRIPD